MLDIMKGACEWFITNNPDFWILAGLSDASFETGGSKYFRKTVSELAAAGFDADCVSSLQCGVNGNLAMVIEKQYGHLGPLRGNVSRGKIRPDLWFGTANDGTETLVEVKAVYDMTLHSFYGHKDDHGVADDRDKLLKVRGEGFSGHLLQVVFFLELPNYDYPAGSGFPPSWRPHKGRKYYQNCCGIAAQYHELRKHLNVPTWPGDWPHVHRLPIPSKRVQELLERWFEEAFVPDDGRWKFVAEKQLDGAGVGYAIWQY